MVDNWGFVAVFALIALSFPVMAMSMAWLFRPHRAGPIKTSTYECGLETTGDAWVQFKVQYYLFALVFLVFDLETVYLFPWAVAYNRLPLFALVEMALFVLVLATGLVYAWRKGALKWV